MLTQTSRVRAVFAALLILGLAAWSLGAMAHQGHGPAERGDGCGVCHFGQMAMADQLPDPAIDFTLKASGALWLEAVSGTVGDPLPARASRAPPSCSC